MGTGSKQETCEEDSDGVSHHLEVELSTFSGGSALEDIEDTDDQTGISAQSSEIGAKSFEHIPYIATMNLLQKDKAFLESPIAEFQQEMLLSYFTREEVELPDGMAWSTEVMPGCSAQVSFTFLEQTGGKCRIRSRVEGFQCQTLHLLSLLQYPLLWPPVIPFLEQSAVAHEFAFNDWFVELFINIPVPFLPKIHNVTQVVWYDLLEEKERALLGCLRSPTEGSWRGVPTPPCQPGHKRVDKEDVFLLIQPKADNRHTFVFSADVDFPFPRWVLSSRVVTWILNHFIKTVMCQFAATLNAFPGSPFDERMRQDMPIFQRMSARLQKCEQKWGEEENRS